LDRTKINGMGEGGSRMLIPGIVLLLTFLSGIGFGLFMGSWFPSSSVPENATPTHQSTDSPGLGAQPENQVDSQLNSRIHELEKELSEERNGEEALILQDRLTFFKKHHDGLNLEAFGSDLKVTPAMADVLGLTEEEQKAVEQHLAQIKSEVDKFEDANMTVVNQSANSVTFEVPINAGGEALKAKLDSLISSDIGGDRAELFMSSIGPSPFEGLAAFDENKRQIEIAWKDQNGAPLYTTKESYFGPDGNSQGAMSMTGNTLQPKYAKLLQPESAQ
jgi:hypothetical protein